MAVIGDLGPLLARSPSSAGEIETDDEHVGADPEILFGWLRGRSLARKLPQPVADHGGWRIDTASPQETMRFVFAGPCDGLQVLACEITAPLVFLKVCADAAVLRGLTPPWWSLRPPGWLMTCDGEQAQRPVPVGYRCEVMADGAVHRVRLSTQNGELAASGYAAELDGVLAFDRIEVVPDYRRQGLGGAVMSALMELRRSPASRPVLVATADGCELYRSLGWRVRSPYATAVIER